MRTQDSHASSTKSFCGLDSLQGGKSLKSKCVINTLFSIMLGTIMKSVFVRWICISEFCLLTRRPSCKVDPGNSIRDYFFDHLIFDVLSMMLPQKRSNNLFTLRFLFSQIPPIRASSPLLHRVILLTASYDKYLFWTSPICSILSKCKESSQALILRKEFAPESFWNVVIELGM